MLSLMPHYYSVHYQAQPPLIRGLVLRPLTATEFTEACELLLAQAQEHDCPYWLLDGRADENIRPPALFQWLVEDFLPRVPKVLGRVPCLAFVAQPRFWREFQARNSTPDSPGLFVPGFRTGLFTEEAMALDWLDTFRTSP
ncbi:hypothetical protein [Hymenobacter sp.]|uniref:hypothetical protein n=1 Tax=Hymenobacter sp. TaxID=1898978 RepID=UPI00286C9ED3|nr:hypothetical protein [Hymenobacter sp.]